MNLGRLFVSAIAAILGAGAIILLQRYGTGRSFPISLGVIDIGFLLIAIPLMTITFYKNPFRPPSTTQDE